MSTFDFIQIFRKAAFRLVSEPTTEKPIRVDNTNLKEFVGREKFTSERLYEITPPGVIMGLAWTAMGKQALRNLLKLQTEKKYI
jgi:Lon-like ATP-dependent protease